MQRNYNGARAVNIVLGVWLFISAWLWPHSQAQFTNTWIMGAAMTAVAVIGLWAPQIRFLNTAGAVWLFISAFVLATYMVGTVWNNGIVAVAMFLVSLAGGYGARRLPTTGAPTGVPPHPVR